MARSDLYTKHCEQVQPSEPKKVDTQIVTDPLQLEWLCDESSDRRFYPGGIKKEKERKEKNVKFSPSYDKKGKDQGNPGLPRKRGRPCKATSLKPQKEREKNNDDTWHVLEL